MECPKKNFFCYLCGLYTPRTHSRNITKSIIEAYDKYYVSTYRNLWYVPEIICDYCHRSLAGLEKKTHRPKYVQPMTWLPRTEHSERACYFCVNHPGNAGIRYINRENIDYQDVESIIPAILRSAEHLYSPSETAEQEQVNANVDHEMETYGTSQGASTPQHSAILSMESSSGYSPSIREAAAHGIQHLITQADFEDLIRDMNLSQRNREILGSRLKQWNLVVENFKVSAAPVI